MEASVTVAADDAPRWSLGPLLLLGLALVVGWCAMEPGLDGPWQWGWKGHNGARYAHIARNYERLGLTHAGGAPLMDPAGADPATPDVYAHHPPGVMWLTALVYRVTGVAERPARLVSVAATLVGLLLLALLVGATAGAWAGAAAALLWAGSPMTAAYGSHVEVQGPAVLTAGLAVLLAARHAARGGSLLPWLLAALAASAFDWFGLYFAAGTTLVALASPARRRQGLAMAATTAALFAGWLLWLGSLPGMSPGRVLFAAGVRVGGGSGAEQAALGDYVAQWWSDSLALMPGWPLLLALVVALIARPAWGGRSRVLLVLLLGPPLAHAAAFPAGMLVHNYWLFALPPALAAGLAVALRRRPAALVVVALAGGSLGLVLDSARDAELLGKDGMPALVGQALAEHTEPGDVILTSYLVNPLVGGDALGDRYLVRLPEVLYYADRRVRGGITRLEDGQAFEPPGLRTASARVPEADWFLLVPMPLPVQASLLDELARRSREVTTLNRDPPVTLHRLAR